MAFSFFRKKQTSKAKKQKKSALREWLDAIVFAGAAAIIIRTFILEAFLIPTASMERTLMVGDFLFVSKFHYGARLPMAPLSFPFVHNKLPFTNVKSYLDWIRFPYLRLPGISSVKRNEIVVFNYPADDVKANNPDLGTIDIPSLKENYIKRCVAQPGDRFEIKDTEIYINGVKTPKPPEFQDYYRVVTKPGEPFNQRRLEEYGFRDPGDPNKNYEPFGDGATYQFFMPTKVAEVIRGWDNVSTLERFPDREISDREFKEFGQNVYAHRWSLDNYGPFVVPKKGATIKLDKSNVDIYERCIVGYEHNKLDIRGDKIYINELAVDSYTFEMDYYFMMGDNRYNSQDSRYWGFVPEDHIVGKPMFVLFSFERGVRWSRIFKGIN